MQNNTGVSGAYDDSINLLDLVRTILAGWVVIASCVAISLVGAVIYLLVATPVYRATVVMQEVDTSTQGGGGAAALLSQFGGLASLAGIDARGLGGTRSNGRMLIQSRTFAEEFITRNGLFPIVMAEYWDGEGDPPPISSAAGVLRSEFELNLDRETGLLMLSVEWTDPQYAADWANGMVALANNLARERDIANAERSVDYLNEQIEKTNIVELRQALYSLLEAEQRTLMLANARDEYVFQVVDPALVPGTRARPKRNIVLFLGLFIGLVVGLTALYIVNAVRHMKAFESAVGR